MTVEWIVLMGLWAGAFALAIAAPHEADGAFWNKVWLNGLAQGFVFSAFVVVAVALLQKVV